MIGVAKLSIACKGGGKMRGDREYMLDRLIKIKQKDGNITVDALKKDPLLDWYKLLREFKNLKGMKDQVELRMRALGIADENLNTSDFDLSSDPSSKSDSNFTPGSDSTTSSNSAKLAKNSSKAKVPKYSSETVYAVMLEFAKELGRVPREMDIKERSKQNKSFPSAMTVRRYLPAYWREQISEDLAKLGIDALKVNMKVVEHKPPKQFKEEFKLKKKLNTKDNLKSKSESESKNELESKISIFDEDDIEPDLVFDDISVAKECLDGVLESLEFATINLPNFESRTLIQVNTEDGGIGFIYVAIVK